MIRWDPPDMGRLATLHPFPHVVHFNTEHHKYGVEVDGEIITEGLISVSKLVERCKGPFEPRTMCIGVAKQQVKLRESFDPTKTTAKAHFRDYRHCHTEKPCDEYEMRERIIAHWEVANLNGTINHLHTENHIARGDPLPEGDEFDQLRRYFAHLPHHHTWFRTEFRLASLHHGLTGTPDAVALRDGKFWLIDWKFCRDIRGTLRSSTPGLLKGPLAWTGLRATNINTYALSEGCYTFLLSLIGLDMFGIELVVAHENQSDIEVVRLRRCDDLIAHLLHDRLVEIGKPSDAPPRVGVPTTGSLEWTESTEGLAGARPTVPVAVVASRAEAAEKRRREAVSKKTRDDYARILGVRKR